MNMPHFYLEERPNVFSKYGDEFALNVRLDRMDWTLRTWDEKPDKEEFQKAVELAMRSFELYHQHIHQVLPQFISNHTVEFRQ